MVLKEINPTKILLYGDKVKAETFIGPAKSQMNILLQEMSFQNLSQGVRKVHLFKDVFIICTKVFNYQECSIFVTPVLEELTDQYFFIIFSTGSGEEAVLWDLLSDSAFSPLDSTIEDIRTKLNQFQITSEIEAVLPQTSSFEWIVDYDPSNASDESESFLMQPKYLIGNYGLELGYLTVQSAHFPSSYTYDALDLIETVSWDFNYVDESPVPYYSKKLISGVENETDEKSSYITSFGGVAEGETTSLIREFEFLTGASWPTEGGQKIDIYRNFAFWQPFFWYSMNDIQGSFQNLSAENYGIQLADTWQDGEWSEYPLSLDRSSRIRKSSGIATNITSDNLTESILFEYVGICRKFIDTYGSDLCDLSQCELEEYLRIYTYGKIKFNSFQQAIFDGTNNFRVAEGLFPLVKNSVLTIAAQRHADDLAKIIDDNFSLVGHRGSDGSYANDRITDAGYFTWIDIDLWGYKISENVQANFGYADPVAIALTSWRNSTEHWENIIDEAFCELGIGTAISPNGKYVFVQNFGKVDNRYPGYSPFDTTNLQTYINENFVFDPANETTRVPKIYLIGSVNLGSEQVKILSQEEI